ncbi:SPW repeat protein [Actinacidiphila acidipaludis]|uniref:SPW repeat protein n=1 Tax=Actinacidiphila acidipaludis TaxID=2873382 RepID=A0ABS7Q707_9ACTN|nr:SPW repeat protein [Streptomyces acidipaludis]MBY8878935.1 SPW repeat protein [Streptomyces acidipaludis]
MATDSSHPTGGRSGTAAAPSDAHIESHPDILSLRNRYAAVSETPVSGLVEGLCLLTGLYLAISPWVVGFQGFAGLRVSNLITGIALAVLGMGYGSVLERTHNLGWVACAIGVWTIIAPWCVAGQPSFFKVILSNAIVGGVACALGLATMGMGFMAKRRARRAAV